MTYKLADLVRHFGRGTVDVALEHVAHREVDLLPPSADGSRLFGVVRDFRNKSAHASARVERNGRGTVSLSGECSCRFRKDCDHVAALLLAALGPNGDPELKKLHRGPSRPAAAADPARVHPTSPPAWKQAEEERAVDGWLARVAQALSGQGTASDDRSPRQVVLYILSATAGPPYGGRSGIRVHPVTVRVNKRGGYGRWSHCSYNGGASGASYVTVEDRQIFAALLAAAHDSWSSGFHSPIALQVGPAADLLERLIGTRRCHWQDKDAPALEAGEQRSGRIEWTVDAEGLQRPAIRIDGGPAIVLPIQPFWYVDPVGHRSGPLALDVDPQAAAALLGAPPLSPSSAEQVREDLLANFPDKGLPLPAAMFVGAVEEHVSAVPHLQLFLHRARSPAGWRPHGMPAEIAAPAARLTFLYGGLRVVAGDSREVVQYVADGAVRRLRRDSKAERKAVHRLRSLDMITVEELGIPAAGTELAGCFVPLADDEDQDAFLIQFGLDQVPRLRADGWQVDVAADYPWRVVEEPAAWYAEVHERKDGDWFDLELGIDIGGQRHSLLPILLRVLRDPRLKLSAGNPDAIPTDRDLMVRLEDGRLFPLPGARLKAIAGTLVELYGADRLEPGGALALSPWNAPRLAELEDRLGGTALQWSGGEALRSLGRKLRDFSRLQAVAVPDGFSGTLRPYQREGLSWLQFLREHALAGILADDMGLGKTIQILAHLLVEKDSGRMDRPSLVVAPTSLMANWRREAERFAPGLRVLILQGVQRKSRFGAVGEHDLVLTTYPLLSRDEETLKAQAFHLLILDEAQFIKNAKSKAAQIASRIEARHRLCLTGTPMENHLGELWSLFNFLLPGLLGDDKRFRKVFRTPIEKHASRERSEQLAARIRPFLLRRTKDQVAAELPPKTEIKQVVELHDAQRDLYESIRLAMHERVRKEVARKGLARSTIVILDALLKLRQVCCDPRLLKARNVANVTASAKLDALRDMLEELLAEGRRILLFSQFTSMLTLIEDDLHIRGLTWVKLTGDTRDRETPIRRFQSGEVPLFLISLKAGGTGLNLQAADTVIHYDPWWNPAVQEQATDRAHRIGQDKPVFVYKLIAAGSVEEKILALQARKRELAAGIYGKDAGSGPPLSADDLEALFQPLD